MRFGLCSVAVIVMAAASTASAEPVRVNLTYVRKGVAAGSCPDEPTFRALVAARLGYDPFAPGGDLALLVELKPQGPELVGRLGLTNARGDNRGQRTVRAGDMDCLELASSMALAAAFALDPEAVRARAEPAPPPPPPPLPPSNTPPAVLPKPPPDALPPAPRERTSVGFRMDAGFVLPVGIVPEPRGGLRAGAGLDGGVWSLSAEGAYLFATSRQESFGEVSASVAYGSLVPCFHPRLHDAVRLDLCGGASVGAMFSTASNVSRPDPVTDWFATVWPRAGATFMPWSNVGFGAAVDVPVPLSRVRLAIDDAGQRREVWAMAPVGLMTGLSLVLRLR